MVPHALTTTFPVGDTAPLEDCLFTLETCGMTVTSYRVSERGQMALPAEARRRWNLTDGGAVEVADLGHALVGGHLPRRG
jgi:hypothetical protein